MPYEHNMVDATIKANASAGDLLRIAKFTGHNGEQSVPGEVIKVHASDKALLVKWGLVT